MSAGSTAWSRRRGSGTNPSRIRHAATPTGHDPVPSVRTVLAHATTFALDGLGTRRVRVEVDVRPGLPAFTIVGLGDAAVREARERVRAAILNAGLEFPLRRITANLAPADLRKVGPGFDLALACAVLAASGQVPPRALGARALYAELSLSGELRRCRGVLAVAEAARAAGIGEVVVAPSVAGEAALVPGLTVSAAPGLADVAALLRGAWEPPAVVPHPAPAEATGEGPDLADVLGQPEAVEALIIAAAGGHNLLMVGPPGTGKTMLARRLPGILPPMSTAEALDVTRIQSIAGLHCGDRLADRRPFRAPHHTISAAGLVGGGAPPRPGEVTLAHHGVLFLDELSEFARPALEALRQPLEDGAVTIVRGQRGAVFPSRCMVIGATNPCPCGRGAPHCGCSVPDRLRHARKLTGPLLDRMDLVCAVGLPDDALLQVPAPSTAQARERVGAARAVQAQRARDGAAACNAHLSAADLGRHAALDGPARRRLDDACARGQISMRGRQRIRRVARTVADLAGSEQITAEHVARALGFRRDVLRAGDER